MARARNWHARTAAEVYIRLAILDQPTQRVADATGLSYQQVHYFAKELKANPGRVPPCAFPNTPAEFEAIRAEVEAATAKEDAATPAAQSTRLVTVAKIPPDQLPALDEEITGCIELVKQAASQFGISPRAFLHLCITHARSMV
jgi:hypothetical protein